MDNGKVNQKFSIKWLMIVTTVISIVCAIFFPWFFRLDLSGQYFCGTILLYYLLVSIAVFIFLVLRRRRIKAQAGEFLVYVRAKSSFVNTFAPLFTFANCVGILAFVIYLFSPKASGVDELDGLTGESFKFAIYFSVIAFSITPLVICAYCLTTFFWGLSWFGAEFFQNGFCTAGYRFTPWSSVKSYQWIKTKKLWQLRMLVGIGYKLVLCDNEQKDEAEQILQRLGLRNRGET